MGACRYFLWRFGETAAPAIQEIAETGAGENFFAEVDECGDACSEGVSIMCTPMSGTCTGSGTIMASPDRPYISIATMIAPSPDWYALHAACMLHTLEPLCTPAAATALQLHD